MTELTANSKSIDNVFQLMGVKEDDITKSIAYALYKCPVFMKNVIKDLINTDFDSDNVIIKYQESEKNGGRTDLEITDERAFYIIIEAKRGWALPQKDQLLKYSERESFVKSCAPKKMLVTMSECSTEYADAYLPFKNINGVPVAHLPWKRVYEIAEKSIKLSTNAQKNILNELLRYLGGVMSMQVQESNWVFVVSLGKEKPENCELTWIDIVKKKNRYFHPLGNGWPKEPPNYIAFRYDGRLQSIHHIEGYKVTKNLHDVISEMPSKEEPEHFVYELGVPIIPSKTVKTGKIYPSGRVWAMLDTLLTADTISEARDISQKRLEKKSD